jgi:hypothetical protein
MLCGLAVGRASKPATNGRRHAITVHVMEGAPSPCHPLKGTIRLFVIAAAELYGVAVRSNYLRLMDPGPSVLGLYRELRFLPVGIPSGGAYYCERRIS